MRQFLKWMAASTLGTLIGLVAFTALIGLGVGSVLTLFLATTARETQPEIESDSVLVLDLSTDIRDAVPPSGASVVLEETLSGNITRTISSYQAIRAIEQAAEDDDIVGLFIYGNSSEGFATLRELRQSLLTFQAADKPIWAYAVDWSERDYYLTSFADTVVLDQSGLLEFNGFRSEIQFLTGALEKYGIGVQVLRVGRYKSAVEPFIRTESSPEEQEQTQALLADFWREFLLAVESSRALTPARLQALADQGGLLLPADAKAAGLVDEIAYYDDVLTQLQTLTGEDESVGEDIPSIDLVSYSQLLDSPFQNPQGAIALLYVEGDIVLGEGGDGLVGADRLARTLRDLRFDDSIEAVVLRINSPGGGASAAEIAADAVRRLQQVKPVVVSMGNLAASGGYMIATEGDHIFASPNTLTGSIGVFGLLLNFQEIANRNGITWDILKTARYADIDTLTRPQTAAELALQQSVVDDTYDRFITRVAESREMPKANVEAVAQGRIWSGEDAQAAGLVDELGGLQAAIAYAAEQADLETWRVEEYPRPKSLESQIFDSLFGNLSQRLQPTSHPLTQELRSLQENLVHLETLNDPRGTYLRLPFTTEIE